jgi:undecaprenyl-diphosphatase
MNILKIAILAFVQGIAELLPVSSSAHVIVAEKILGMNPVAPEMTMLLVMLHTGTMFAVIAYFWKTWKKIFFGSKEVLKKFIINVVIATFFTGVVGVALQLIIEKIVLRHVAHAEVEMIFGNTTLISIALAAAGIFIIVSGFVEKAGPAYGNRELNAKGSAWIGAVQGICLPFRGFSRSGATISTGIMIGIDKTTNEAFSFALAVVLTPPVILREALRLFKTIAPSNAAAAFYPGLAGMVLSFIAGLFALRWLSGWLNRGLWKVFGFYCLAASAALFFLARSGF